MDAEEEKANTQTINEMLLSLVHKRKDETISVGEIMSSVHQKGFALLMMLLVLPNCVPIPVPPGTSTIFSIPLLFLVGQMILGFSSPWVPLFLRQRRIKRAFLVKALTALKPYLEKVEKTLRPRYDFLMRTTAGERITGLVWLVFSFSIAVPLPMTNFLPGIGILISAIGFLRRDGVVFYAGLGIGSLGIAFSLALVLFGMAFVKQLLPFAG